MIQVKEEKGQLIITGTSADERQVLLRAIHLKIADLKQPVGYEPTRRHYSKYRV